jgi:hypothetical protein
MRIALTKVDCCTNDHGDTGNDASDPRYTPSGVVSLHVYVNDVLYRFAMIGYMKRSIATCLDRIEKHSDLIDAVISFYHSFAAKEACNGDPRNLIIPDTDDMPEKNVFNPGLDKMASLYSGFASGVLKVMAKHFSDAQFPMDLKYACAFAIPVNYSNYPEDYWYLCKCISEDNNGYFLSNFVQSIPSKIKGKLKTEEKDLKISNMSPLQLLRYLSIAVWGIKDAVKEKKMNLYNVQMNPNVGTRTPRMQPNVNSLPSEQALQGSLSMLIELACMVKYFKPKNYQVGADKDIRYLYEMITGYLCSGSKSSNNGVYGCGGLTSQHLFGVCVILGIFEARIACHAEVPKTTLVAPFLYNNYHYSSHTHEEDTRELLIALVTLLKKHDHNFNTIKAEELLCRFMKWKKTSSKQTLSNKEEAFSQFKDTVFKGQDVFTLKVTSEQQGKKKVDLIRYYCKKNSKDVLQESFKGCVRWPLALDQLREFPPLHDPLEYWKASNLKDPKKIAPKKSTGRTKAEESCQRFTEYFPTMRQGRRIRHPLDVTSKDLVMCDNAAVLKAPLSSFGGKGEAVQVNLSSIIKAVFSMEHCKDSVFFKSEAQYFVDHGYPFWVVGLKIPSDDEHATISPLIYPKPTFCLYDNQVPEAKLPSRVFRGKRYFASIGEAKEYCALYYLLTYSATCKRLRERKWLLCCIPFLIKLSKTAT